MKRRRDGDLDAFSEGWYSAFIDRPWLAGVAYVAAVVVLTAVAMLIGTLLR